jgi:tRNA A-37 threonylcarbamoyl transferase component Bud32
MGVVWRAADELIGRSVAVKEVRPPHGFDEDERTIFAERALREARAAGRVNHPAVIAIHDVVPASADDEAVYIVSELVDAPSLAAVLRRDGPMSDDQVIALALQMLDALDAAHTAGIVHRDVKPSNILIHQGEAKLADFGIAHMAEDTRLTGYGVMGSTEYLAPEMFHGEDPSPAADLWALGVTLMEAVEGRNPFSRDSTAATMHAILSEEPRTPECHPALATAIRGLLTRDAEQRMTSQQARALLTSALAAGGAATSRRVDAIEDAQPTGQDAWDQSPTSIRSAPARRASITADEPAEVSDEATDPAVDSSARFAFRITAMVTLGAPALVGLGRWLSYGIDSDAAAPYVISAFVDAVVPGLAAVMMLVRGRIAWAGAAALLSYALLRAASLPLGFTYYAIPPPTPEVVDIFQLLLIGAGVLAAGVLATGWQTVKLVRPPYLWMCLGLATVAIAGVGSLFIDQVAYDDGSHTVTIAISAILALLCTAGAFFIRPAAIAVGLAGGYLASTTLLVAAVINSWTLGLEPRQSQLIFLGANVVLSVGGSAYVAAARVRRKMMGH